MTNKDQNILDSFKLNDESGLKTLFDRYYRPLCVYSMKYLGDIHIAEDIVQEVFIRFWEEKKYKNIKGSLKNYLFVSVRNRSVNYLKSNLNVNTEYIKHLNEEFAFEQFDDDLIAEKKQKLYKEIEKLPPQSKKILKLIVFEKLKYKEVSKELDVSLNTVKTHFSRALKQLRNSICIIILIVIT